MPRSADEVVITGVGVVGPLSGDRESFWTRLLAGERGVRALSAEDFHGLPVGDAGFPLVGAPVNASERPGLAPRVSVHPESVECGWLGRSSGSARSDNVGSGAEEPSEPRHSAPEAANHLDDVCLPAPQPPLDRLSGQTQTGRASRDVSEHAIGEPVLRLLVTAADEAVAHSGVAPGDFDRDRAGCVVGTSKGGIISFARAFLDRGDRTAWSTFLPHTASSAIAARFGLRGPCLGPVAACATGLVCLLRGAELLRDGRCDLILAGAADASLHPAVLGSFRRMGVLASRFDEPAAACRPFNADRDGFVVGEGAAVFVLERRGHAEARGATILATLLGGAVLSDPSGLTAVDPAGETLARAVRDTLAFSRRTASDLGHVNLHGTATRSNDLAESVALRSVFGTALDEIRCVALKGALGHLLGAAGAVETAATVLALRDGRLPPTVNWTAPDPACPLPLSSDAVPIRGCGLKVSLGFGGHVAVACLEPG